MLREPVARTISAYQMCQSMKMGRWCRDPMEEAVAFAMHNHTDPPTLNQQALQLRPALRRTFTLGFYSAHISRWLVHFPGSSMRVQWVEHFKADPFRGMWAAENFLGLPHHDYRQQVTPISRDGSRAEQLGGGREGTAQNGGMRTEGDCGGLACSLDVWCESPARAQRGSGSAAQRWQVERRCDAARSCLPRWIPSR